eukprot:CAMPEP_0181495156 /NCGR_PEP_ID=MMETSP1110-20121109/52216_1 /TAXON_ID=174948 /ORGANISM="Symbiodinium sp., Strain CCMP421" /LENGTH=30 /DNA_ID= /DNA_START= /DNA_END= /DNA_ORIENTATION=
MTKCETGPGKTAAAGVETSGEPSDLDQVEL